MRFFFGVVVGVILADIGIYKVINGIAGAIQQFVDLIKSIV